MKRLTEIPKKSIYRVPEGYFDELPSQIEARMARSEKKQESAPLITYSLRYALPAMILIVAAMVWYTRTETDQTPGQLRSAEEILASIDTEALISYLEEIDVTTDELVESMDLSLQDLVNIEHNVYDLPDKIESTDSLNEVVF